MAPSRIQGPNEGRQTMKSTTRRKEEPGAAEPKKDRSRQTEGHTMILPGNDFAKKALSKVIPCSRSVR
jgi:hypothetical protein